MKNPQINHNASGLQKPQLDFLVLDIKSFYI